MTEYYQAYGTVIALLIAGIALVAIAFLLGRIVSPNRAYGRYGEKPIAFESGIDPVGFGWSQTNVRYYMFAFMFVVFDVETLFVFPWAVYLEQAQHQGFVLGVMLVFLFFVTVTLPYELKKGVLKWV
ncbi:MAG TPA: NADH-quinone oxidoreductase subunit A [Euzebya sp.]|nr:NADH-quinone oxidoreductase subunit A [Euzebya sp.]